MQLDVVKHQGPSQHDGGGVGDALAGDVRGAAVDSFEQATMLADVGAGGHAQAADQAGTQV